LNSDTNGPTIIFYTALINTIQINHSQHTLAMWWNLKNVRPEPLLGFVPKINITYQCSAMFVKPKLKPNSELNVHWASVSHHIAKRNVVR
jgi:hypothetical protein